jgi:pSer/pThr/pTyr-binding forkhead associated (FHA) protein
LLTILAGLGLLGLVLVMLRSYKRYRERVLLETARTERRASWQRGQASKEDNLSTAEEGEPLALTLLWLDETQQVKQRFSIEGDTVTLGRTELDGQLTLDDRSVSPLHARVRWRYGRYWLYDEGSESGVFLNHERLGLSPRPLADNDLIQLGRVSLRAQLRPLAEDDEVGDEVVR